jgi:hypothetical protein
MFRILLVIGVLILASCSSKKKSLRGEEVETVTDFVESFNDIALPVELTDTSIDNKLDDSALINIKLIQKFIPDTLFREFKGTKPKYYAMGKVTDKTGIQYLFIKATTAAKQVGYLLCFDKEKTCKAGMALVSNNTDRNIHTQAGLDRKFTIYINKSRMGKDGASYYRKNVYVYNDIGTFTLILQESNEIPEVKEIYNPIDTFPAKGKWSGNYIKDKKNFVSVRDGVKADRLLFFVHFEENNGECVGELKGEADIIKPGLARYSAPGDPCSLEFSFAANTVNLLELKGCGNYRGIKCFFNGSYPKKAPPKKLKKATKS